MPQHIMGIIIIVSQEKYLKAEMLTHFYSVDARSMIMMGQL